MSKAENLIERMQAVNAEVIQVADRCTAEQWQLPVADEDGRAVGVVFHHIGVAYPFALDWAGKVARGETLPPFDRAKLNVFNARHASEQASTPQADTVAFLRQVTEETAVALQAFSDDQLTQTAAIPLAGGREFSGEWLMEAFAIGHAERHLAAIKSTIGLD